MHLQEMFINLRRGLDNELDAIVTVLAKRSGEVCFLDHLPCVSYVAAKDFTLVA